MEPMKKIISGGEHPIPIYVEQYGSGNGSADEVCHEEADGSQSWSESHDDLAMSSASDEQALGSSGEEFGASPRKQLIVKLRCKEIRSNSPAVRRARNFLGGDLASNAASSSNGSRNHEDKGVESLDNSDTESNSFPSDSTHDSEQGGDPQAGVVGQQFQDGNEPMPDSIEDPELDAVVSLWIIIWKYQCLIANC
jgi:hypothetical protein